MKVLFIADIHLKLGQKNVPVDWAKNRYSMFFEQVLKMQEGCDIVVIGGDIFDKVPNMEELELYFKFVKIFKIPTFFIPGNHEAEKRNTTFLTKLKEVTSTINSNIVIIDDYCSIHGIDFIPYNKLKEFEKDVTVFPFIANVLVTHVRGEIPPHVKSEVDLDIFSKWKVVLAGDLHSYSNSQRNILYPGSPMTTSFHRDVVTTGAIILDTETLEHKWVQFNLPQLLRKTLKAGDEMPATEYHHTIYELEGDLSELSAVEDSELLDKKIVKRSIDTALILHPEMTLEAEVNEYLQYILQLNEGAVEAALKELNNHIGKIE